MSKNLTQKEQLSKDKLQEFIKDRPILKQQQKFDRMEKALEEIKDLRATSLWVPAIMLIQEAEEIAREALKED